MEGEVYGDVLFLVNFSMDFLCFFLCARLLHRRLSLLRGAVASALGGIYAVAVLFWEIGRVPAFLVDLGVCFVLCAIALAGKKEGPRSQLTLWGLYLLISSLMGGVMTVLYDRLNRIPGLTEEVGEEGLSAWVFLGVALLSAGFTSLWGRWFRRPGRRGRIRVILRNAEKEVSLDGIFDSGNLLTDPMGGKAVIPVDTDVLRQLLPREIQRAAVARHPTDHMALFPPELAKRIRLIPAKGATGEKLLLAWQPDYLALQDERGEHEIQAYVAPIALRTAKDGVEALVPTILSP